MRRRNWGRIIFISGKSGCHIPGEDGPLPGMTKAAQVAAGPRQPGVETTAGTAITVDSSTTRAHALPRWWPLSSGNGSPIQACRLRADRWKAILQDDAPTSPLLQRFATPEEVAAMVAYVASPLASATNGAALRVDGGTIKTAF